MASRSAPGFASARTSTGRPPWRATSTATGSPRSEVAVGCGPMPHRPRPQPAVDDGRGCGRGALCRRMRVGDGQFDLPGPSPARRLHRRRDAGARLRAARQPRFRQARVAAFEATRDSGSPIASAATCDITVEVPVPRSSVAERRAVPRRRRGARRVGGAAVGRIGRRRHAVADAAAARRARGGAKRGSTSRSVRRPVRSTARSDLLEDDYPSLPRRSRHGFAGAARAGRCRAPQASSSIAHSSAKFRLASPSARVKVGVAGFSRVSRCVLDVRAGVEHAHRQRRGFEPVLDRRGLGSDAWLSGVGLPRASVPRASCCSVCNRLPTGRTLRPLEHQPTGRPTPRADIAASATCDQIEPLGPKPPPNTGRSP